MYGDNWIQKNDKNLKEFISPIQIPFQDVKSKNGLKEGEASLKAAQTDIQAPNSISEDMLKTEDIYNQQGKINLLQLPPGAFTGKYLEESEEDEYEMESLDNRNFKNINVLYKHLLGMEYDPLGYPLLTNQIEKLDRVHGRNTQNPIGKLKVWKSGKVTIQLDGGEFEVIRGAQSKIKRKVFTFDDDLGTLEIKGQADKNFVAIITE